MFVKDHHDKILKTNIFGRNLFTLFVSQAIS
jgi:hypothetical protein